METQITTSNSVRETEHSLSQDFFVPGTMKPIKRKEFLTRTLADIDFGKKASERTDIEKAQIKEASKQYEEGVQHTLNLRRQLVASRVADGRYEILSFRQKKTGIDHVTGAAIFDPDHVTITIGLKDKPRTSEDVVSALKEENAELHRQNRELKERLEQVPVVISE